MSLLADGVHGLQHTRGMRECRPTSVRDNRWGFPDATSQQRATRARQRRLYASGGTQQ